MRKIFRLVLLLAALALSLAVLAGAAAVLLLSLAAALIAACAALAAAPGETKALFAAAAERIDGWLSRLEALWREARAAVDGWGEKALGTASSGVQRENPDGSPPKA
ncbi:MAG: hypothetical protein ACFWTZ_07095 [Burkholderia sp.]|jgi:hypothetical protein